MKNKIIGVCILIISSFCAVISFLVFQQNTITLPFKCIYSTEYTFNYNGRLQKIHLTHDFRFYDKNTGYFIMSGYANIDNVAYQVKRSFLLKDISEKQGKTFEAKIEKNSPLVNDDLPDSFFNVILQEYQIDNNTFQVDFFHLHFNTWLVGGPYAFISVCQRY